MEDIIHNLGVVHKRIENACKKFGRDSKDVRLLLATKTVSAERIKIAIGAGEKLIGENKVQELKDKDGVLSKLNIERHFIGHLQTNKVKEVIKYANCIQSLDRLELAEQLDRRLQNLGKNMDVFIQINTSAEDSKFGIAPDKTISFIKALKPFETLKIKGLMTIGLLDSDLEIMRPCLRLLRETRDRVLGDGIEGIDSLLLSMGMSHDIEIAIEEGSNMVRVGSAVFGNRIPGKEVWH
ncbi:MAG: YggS family pyridoxal phosphate-dependent enzyme [Bacteroidetes bacterium]|nr:YggS family pyridoxal phosphate-dependent enzyme [Bacteroidota bacterium]